MYKKIYVEITNICNLNCSFCIGNKRVKEFITLDNFKIILDKLEGYTKFLYFHIMGEPLMHPNINELIDVASKRYNINITTNGYLIDKINSKFGRRKTGLLIGVIPTIITFVLFLIPLNDSATILNTVWFGVILCLFYSFYTLTMLTYYATFREVCATEKDVMFLSNVKSIFDVVYFSLGFALIPIFIGMKLNIRAIALIFLPLSLKMLIPFFMLKETKNDESLEQSERIT